MSRVVADWFDLCDVVIVVFNIQWLAEVCASHEDWFTRGAEVPSKMKIIAFGWFQFSSRCKEKIIPTLGIMFGHLD